MPGTLLLSTLSRRRGILNHALHRVLAAPQPLAGLQGWFLYVLVALFGALGVRAPEPRSHSCYEGEGSRNHRACQPLQPRREF